MNTQSVRHIAKEMLKFAYKIPRKKATQRTANLYSSVPIDHLKLSPKSSSTVQTWINKKISGSEDVDYLDYIRSKYIPKQLSKVAALGSHHAHFERKLSQRKVAKEIHCYELSEGALKVAKKLSQDQGISNMRYIQADLNNPKFIESHYDAVFATKSLHHIENLESLFENVRNVLKPGGFFFADDFFGPRHLQWTDKQIQLINEIMALLPNELKTDLGSFQPKVIHERQRASVEENIAIDPSEAVRSDDILPVLKNHFDIVEVKNYGGNIHLNLFSKIMGNFRDDHPLSQTIIRLILYIEDLAIREGIFKDSDFKILVAKPRN